MLTGQYVIFGIAIILTISMIASILFLWYWLLYKIIGDDDPQPSSNFAKNEYLNRIKK
jgi:hypothetical protein